LERSELWMRIRRLKNSPRTGMTRHCAWGAKDDELLQEGYRASATKKRKAIQELRKRHPDWSANSIWKRASRLGLVRKKFTKGQERLFQRWSEDDDQELLSLAGEKTLSFIAKFLHRSHNSVRCRLGWLGKRTRTQYDGFARRTLAEQLHMGRKTIQKLIARGLLEVQDPRITRKSISELKGSGILSTMHMVGEALPGSAMDSDDSSSWTQPPEAAQGSSELISESSAEVSRAKRVWAEVGKKLDISEVSVRKLIEQSRLRMYDPRITEDSFRSFCRRYGALINETFLDRETRAWLRGSMDWNPTAGQEIAAEVAPGKVHALQVRTCSRCGRLVRGNGFFRHKKRCRAKPH